jgi:hypothetical protein
MKTSEKDKNHVVSEVRSQKLTLQEIMPELTPQSFPRREDQLRLHSTTFRKQKSFAVCAVYAARSGMGRVHDRRN